MMLCRTLGNLWGFRKQLPDNASWTSSRLDFKSIEPLPWTVTIWKLTAWDPEAEIRSWSGLEQAPSTLKPATWNLFETPPVYPGFEEHMFVLRLRLSHELRLQHHYIHTLSKAYGRDVEVEVYQNPHNPRILLASIYINSKHAELRPHTPLPLGTSLSLQFANLVDYYGEVSAIGSKCLMTGKERSSGSSEPDFQVSMSTPIKFQDVHWFSKVKSKAYLTFEHDGDIFMSHLSAAKSASSKRCEDNSICVPQLLFGWEAPADHNPNHWRENLTEEAKEAFLSELRRIGLSDVQLAFAQECQAPTNRIAIAQGSPGTAGNVALVATIQALIKSGKRVLVCGPTDESLSGTSIRYEYFSIEEMEEV